jgi:hypothetical protein
VRCVKKGCATVADPPAETPPWVNAKSQNDWAGISKTAAEAICTAGDKTLEEGTANPEDPNNLCTYRCKDGDCAAAPQPPDTQYGAWIRITPSNPEPTCTAPKKIMYAFAGEKKCFYQCACNDEKVCKNGGSLTKYGDTSQCTETTDVTDCGTQFACYTCPDSSTPGVCTGKDQQFCTSKNYIDCKGCVAGSLVNNVGAGSGVKPSLAPRKAITDQSGGACSGSVSCSPSTPGANGTPSIPNATLQATGQEWTSQDYCKIYIPQSVSSKLSQYKIFKFRPNGSEWPFRFPEGKSADDHICTGCGVSPTLFMSGPYQPYSSDGPNAGCQNQSCPKSAAGREGDGGSITIARSSGDCSGYCEFIRNCNRTGSYQSCPMQGRFETGDTCGWTDYCKLGIHPTGGQAGCGSTSHPQEYCESCGSGDDYDSCCDTYCGSSSCSSQTCNPTYYNHDLKAQACDSTQIYGRQVKAAYKIIDKDESYGTFDADKCDVDRDFTIIFDKDSTCEKEAASAPGVEKYKPGASGGDIFNPCECKVEKYTVNYSEF